MTRAAPVLFAYSWLVLLSACAPVILGRTPTPTAAGVTKWSVGAGYPVGLTEAPPDADTGLFDPIVPAYWPLPSPLDLRIAYGRSETLETNVGIMVSPGLAASVETGNPSNFNLGLRYGAKNRFQGEPLELAFDYGGSLYLTNVGVDAGILAAVPLGDAKLYSGLRGFGVLPGRNGGLGGAAALTLGGEVPLADSRSVMLELTLLTNLYNGRVYEDPGPGRTTPPQPTGFSLIPAITFNF